MSAGPTPAGWYADPQDPSLLRWWDGSRWSERTRPTGSTDERWAAGTAADGVEEPSPPPSASGLRTVVLVLIFAAAVGVAGLWLSSVLTDADPASDPAALDEGEIEIYLCDDRTCPAISDDELAELEAQLAADPDVDGFRFVSKQEAYERFAELFADEPDLVESVDPDVLAASFQLWLRPHARARDVADRYRELPGVEEAIVLVPDER